MLIKIAGSILLIIGLVLAIKPDLLGKYPTSIDAYQMIEKRIKWGVLIGFGIFLIFNTNWTSWGLITTALLTALTLGVIMAN